MKKCILIVLATIVVLSLAGCSSSESSTTSATSSVSSNASSEISAASSISSVASSTLSSSTISSIELTNDAISLTTNTLKTDKLVKDVAIEMSSNKKTIDVAIQVNAETSKEHAKDIVDTVVRQLGSNCGGKTPTKNYLGEIWGNYYGLIRIFSGTNTVIVDATISKGGNIIIYHNS